MSGPAPRIGQGFRGLAVGFPLAGEAPRVALARAYEGAARVLRAASSVPLEVDVEQTVRGGAAWLWIRPYDEVERAHDLVLSLWPDAEPVR